MGGVLTGFADIGAVIALGAVLAHFGVLTEAEQNLLAKLAFFVTVPALMLVTVSNSPVERLFSTDLLAIASGIAVAGGIYILLARAAWGRSAGETTIGFMSATYVNAGNLGIPISSYVLGSPAYIAPTLMFQLLVIQPICLSVLDADRRGRFSWKATLARPIATPLTLAAFIGALLALLDWRLPDPIEAPLELVGGMAVPSMLLAYGIALRLGPKLGGGGSTSELATTTFLKLLVQPAVAWLVAGGLLGVGGHALLVIVVASALPTAQNIFVHAVRHDRATTLARDTILLTTFGSVPVIIAVAAILS